MFSASPISLTDMYTPSSSMRCQRHARVSALTSVLPGCGFEVGTIWLPSGATMRLRPARRWKRIGMRMTSVEPSCLGPGSCRHPLALLPQLANQAREILGPDAHLERVLLHVDPLDEELND